MHCGGATVVHVWLQLKQPTCSLCSFLDLELDCLALSAAHAHRGNVYVGGAIKQLELSRAHTPRAINLRARAACIC